MPANGPDDKRVRHDRTSGDRTGPESANILIADDGGLAMECNETHHAGNCQDGHPAIRDSLYEGISWEQHQIELLSAILPATNAAVGWHKAAESAPFQLPDDLFFVAGVDREGVPISAFVFRRVGQPRD